MSRFLCMAVGVLMLLSCEKGGDLFKNPNPQKTGLLFTNQITETDELNILDYLYFYNGGGVAVGDINNDGLPDIYFTGNQVPNKLFINKGNLQFEDITQKAGVAGNNSWSTGVTMADVNGDGWLDIYACAVVGINGFKGYNELFINNQDGTFSEQSSDYGLDFDSYSSHATFFDYDLDGDLDLFLLNHAVHTQESYGQASLRLKRNYETGDKLLRNDGATFVDVSEEAGIYGGINGYGLGLAVADFNTDGYPDIFVGNDFHEDDYYYLNNGDGTFSEQMRTYFGHTSRFSMGNDVADINHDGLPDLISLDMLPEDEKALKASEGDDNEQTQRMRTKQYGYHYQFSRNMLYINRPNGKFQETALLSGIAATDWSWSALFGDYDQDGYQDLFIANGIPRRPNDLDFVKFTSTDQIQNKLSNTKLVDNKALDLMPSGAVPNYIFKGGKDLEFKNQSANWIHQDSLNSNSVAYADLDLDGDLDLVVNNLNHPSELYINQTNASASYLKLKFRGIGKNTQGIGVKAYAYIQDKVHYRELQPSRGFQSSSEPILHFGLGNIKDVDSLRIIWPNKTQQSLKGIKANQTLIINQKEAKPLNPTKREESKNLFKMVANNLGIDFIHEEDNYVDFNREKLIPYKLSDRGPAFAIGDLNGDGTLDLFFGGSKFIAPQLYKGADTIFTKDNWQEPTQEKWLQHEIKKEDVNALIHDFNGDGLSDLIIASGGGDFFGNSEILTDSYYVQKDGQLQPHDFPKFYQNTSVIKAADYDNDGDLDLFLGGHSQTGKFGAGVPSYVLKNQQGSFEIDTKFELTGMVTDAEWVDYNRDGNLDLMVVGEWMSPKLYTYKAGDWVQNKLPLNQGLWQSVQSYDIDQDGDLDFLLGNWGLNTKFRATAENPLRMYFGDFDHNGQTETLVGIEKEGEYYALETLDGLSGQMVHLRKKYNNYSSFAGQTLEEIMNKETLESAMKLEVNNLASGVLLNQNGAFEFQPFGTHLQTAPITAFCKYDFDNDGQEEVLLGGNYFGVKPYHGRFDSFTGALLKSNQKWTLADELGLDFMFKSVRHLQVFELNQKKYLIVVYNDEPLEVYALHKSN